MSNSSEDFLTHLQEARELIATWPEWKRNILGNINSEMQENYKREKHKEVLIKVNSWVDEEIAPLIIILNKNSCIMTLDSCQGDVDENEQAYIIFRSTLSPSHLFNMVSHFAKELSDPTLIDGFRFEINITGSCDPTVRFLFDPRLMPEIIAAFQDMETFDTNLEYVHPDSFGGSDFPG